MFENFHLAAIVKSGQNSDLTRIPLHQDTQTQLARNWHEQFNSFLHDAEEIQFDAAYKPEQHECFSLQDYSPPDWLERELSSTLPGVDGSSIGNTSLEQVKGIAAFALEYHNNGQLVLFQNFTRSHIIKPGGFLWLDKDTYTTPPETGLTLSNELSAILIPDEKKLLFRNFRNVNSFLPLSDFYNEASEQEIRKILEHSRLAPENIDSLAEGANQWFRKRFALLRDSRVLDNYTAQEISDLAPDDIVTIRIEGDRIVFPSDRVQAKRLLQYLNEEIYHGDITKNIYETNSKRIAN